MYRLLVSPEEPRRPGYDRPSETPDGRMIRYTGTFPPCELGRDDTWTGLGPALANACNTPFRYWKKEIDGILATCAEILGADRYAVAAVQTIMNRDGAEYGSGQARLPLGQAGQAQRRP
jgi:hypothetical protein